MFRKGAESVDDCLPCLEGSYCDGTGVITPVDCPFAKYCPSGATSATYSDCTAGNYCPANAAQEYQCAYGKFVDSTTAPIDECDPCTAGYYCNALAVDTPTDCDAGYYCPEGSSNIEACDEGYMTSGTLNTADTDCVAAVQGTFIKSPGTSVTGLNGQQVDGYYSAGTAEKHAIPTQNGVVCPYGHYCVAGAKTECSAGKYCEDVRHVADGQDCDPGFYCELASQSIRPRKDTFDQQGDICPEK